jgi:hypothetical protein
METIAKAMPHISIILSGMLIVFFIIDRFNSAMGFLDNDGAKILILLLGVTSIINSIMLIAHQRRLDRPEDKPLRWISAYRAARAFRQASTCPSSDYGLP